MAEEQVGHRGEVSVDGLDGQNQGSKELLHARLSQRALSRQTPPQPELPVQSRCGVEKGWKSITTDDVLAAANGACCRR